MPKKIKHFFKKNFNVAFLLGLIALFGICTDSFFSFDNMITILRQASILGMCACGLMFLLLSGNIDLSLGAVMSFISVFFAQLISTDYYNLNPIVAIIIVLALGAIFGYLKGWLITWTGMNALIATLGLATALKGVTFLTCNAKIITNINQSVVFIGQGYVGPIPIPVIACGVMLAVSAFVLKKTYFGRYIYATGSNEYAAYLGGINVDRVKRICFVLASLCATIASVVLTLRVKTGQPNCGDPYQMNVLIACTVGGISFGFGSGGGVLNVLYGVLIVGIITNGMTIMGVDSYYQYVMQGMILVVAVGLDYLQRKKGSK